VVSMESDGITNSPKDVSEYMQTHVEATKT